MNSADAEKLARSLMTKHGLDAKLFSFDNAVRRFGVCRSTRVNGVRVLKAIQLSRKLVELNSVEEVTDTILHEIAHALTLGDGHGRKWKAKCVEIGCRPIRCYSTNEVVTPKLRYKAECVGCGVAYQQTRIPKQNRSSSCRCQNHLPWSKKLLLDFKKQF